MVHEHLEGIYTATEEEKEYAWKQLDSIHRDAFARPMTPLLCHPNDIRNLVAELTLGKAGGVDGMPSQVLKHFTQPPFEVIAEKFQQLANNPAYKPNERPEHWNSAIVTLLAKKPQAQNLDDFRPISLIPQLQKLYSKWLYALLRPTADQCIPSSQHGFRPKRQAAEIHHLLNKLQEIGHEWRMQYIVLKVDIRKAFDTISRGAILEALRHSGAHVRLIWANSRELLSHRMHPQLYGVSCPQPVMASTGVKQGSPESGMLYCLTIAHFTRPAIKTWDRRGFGHRVGPNW